jgi:hypothetical protein
LKLALNPDRSQASKLGRLLPNLSYLPFETIENECGRLAAKDRAGGLQR